MAKDKKKKLRLKLNSDNILKILVLLLTIITVIVIIAGIFNKDNIDSNNKLVSELHNYFNSDDLSNCEGLFNYSDKVVEYDSVNGETRMCLAYQKSNTKKAKESTIKAEKKSDTCTYKGLVFRKDEESNKCSYKKIKREVIDETYKKLYGKEVEDNDSFRIDNLNICYLKGDYYYCGLSETFTYTISSESIIYRVIKKAVEKGDNIIIYDYFTKIKDNECYENYTTTTINEKCTEKYSNRKKVNYKFLKKYGTEYKHIYKKAKDGSYYWVSSEPVK